MSSSSKSGISFGGGRELWRAGGFHVGFSENHSSSSSSSSFIDPIRCPPRSYIQWVDFEAQRQQLGRVLERAGIREDVRAAMDRVPRHRFVPESLHHVAYVDEALPIGHEQTISQP